MEHFAWKSTLVRSYAVSCANAELVVTNWVHLWHNKCIASSSKDIFYFLYYCDMTMRYLSYFWEMAVIFMWWYKHIHINDMIVRRIWWGVGAVKLVYFRTKLSMEKLNCIPFLFANCKLYTFCVPSQPINLVHDTGELQTDINVDQKLS